jgi:hypothetical protein
MSYLAIGAVTKALAVLLEKKMNTPPLLGAVVPKVTTLPPDDDRVSDNDGVNLFLYRVVEDPFNKNAGWRGDRSNPNGSNRPPLTLNLFYMLTSYAKQSNGANREDITAHQLLGNAMAILHEYPVLNDVHDADFDADLDAQFAKELRDSYDKIKVTLMPTSVEELSKIWTGLNRGYRLSVAYEVSLAQIAPLAPTAAAAAPAGEFSLQMVTFDGPAIAFVTPSQGMAGSVVTLRGSHLKVAGRVTSVMINGSEIAEDDLTKVAPDEIVLTIPEMLERGPRLRLSVVAAGQESEPVFFEVSPWISAVKPLRGITGVPVSIPFDIPTGATVSVEIDGAAATTMPDPDNKIVRAVVPNGIASNGAKPVVLIVNTGTPRRSNARSYEVLPLAESVTVTTSLTPAETVIKVTGQRLDGKDVHVRYGKLLVAKGENLNATEVSVTVARVLPTNLPASVLVDGRETNPLPPLLERIDPQKAFAGDEVTLVGSGLSGQNVSVDFGGTAVVVGAQPFGTQLRLRVPLTLAMGDVTIKATVNGNVSNGLQLTVVG